jgi:hypothetical protein
MVDVAQLCLFFVRCTAKESPVMHHMSVARMELIRHAGSGLVLGNLQPPALPDVI